ncbi:MAG: hypothetical protein OEZ25_05665 [Candidatus Bathyarchaeota archaeon]|nr:hypothetical protein [Candidatus Bathyarchaeota archaeon]
MLKKKASKKRIIVYLEKEVYDRLMEVVLSRVQQKKKFRGVLSEVVNDVLGSNLKNYDPK